MVKVYIIIESYLVMLTFAASFRSAMAEAELESKLLILDLCSLLCTVHHLKILIVYLKLYLKIDKSITIKLRAVDQSTIKF